MTDGDVEDITWGMIWAAVTIFSNYGTGTFHPLKMLILKVLYATFRAHMKLNLTSVTKTVLFLCFFQSADYGRSPFQLNQSNFDIISWSCCCWWTLNLFSSLLLSAVVLARIVTPSFITSTCNHHIQCTSRAHQKSSPYCIQILNTLFVSQCYYSFNTLCKIYDIKMESNRQRLFAFFMFLCTFYSECLLTESEPGLSAHSSQHGGGWAGG